MLLKENIHRKIEENGKKIRGQFSSLGCSIEKLRKLEKEFRVKFSMCHLYNGWKVFL